MTAIRRSSPATLADLLAIPEERRRHEIIDGELVEKEAATGKHGQAQGRVFRALGPYDRRSSNGHPGGWIFATEAEIEFSPVDIFRPDVSGWRRERLASFPDDFPIKVRPDWVCEILSTNKRHDRIKKKRAYHRYGVPHYWLVDAREEILAFDRWSEAGYVEVLSAERGEAVRAEPFEAIELRVSTLFGDDES